MVVVKSKIRTFNLDILGATLSLLCGIHCVVFPILIIAQPVLENNFFFSETVENIILATSLLIAVGSFTTSFFKHSKKVPFVFFLSALLLVLGLKSELLTNEHLFMPAIGLLLTTAHVINHKLLHRA